MFYWTPLIEIFVLLLFIGCQSAWDICSLFTQWQWQWLVVTKQIFRPSEFFPVTITDKSTQISIWLNIYFRVITDSPGLALLCVARLQTNCDCPYKVLPIPYLGCRPGWTSGVGGTDESRPDTWRLSRSLPASRSLIPSGQTLHIWSPMSPSPCHHRRYMIESHTQLWWLWTKTPPPPHSQLIFVLCGLNIVFSASRYLFVK